MTSGKSCANMVGERERKSDFLGLLHFARANVSRLPKKIWTEAHIVRQGVSAAMPVRIYALNNQGYYEPLDDGACSEIVPRLRRRPPPRPPRSLQVEDVFKQLLAAAALSHAASSHRAREHHKESHGQLPSLKSLHTTPKRLADIEEMDFYRLIKPQLPNILAVEWVAATIEGAVYAQAMMVVGKCEAYEWSQACLALGIDFLKPPYNNRDIVFRDVFGHVAMCMSRHKDMCEWDKLKQMQPRLLATYDAMMKVRVELGIAFPSDDDQEETEDDEDDEDERKKEQASSDTPQRREEKSQISPLVAYLRKQKAEQGRPKDAHVLGCKDGKCPLVPRT